MKIPAFLDRFIARHKVITWFPPFPDFPCETCGELFDRPIAFDTGDGWVLAWECPSYCGEATNFIEEWPWIRDAVSCRDWEAVGVEVV